MKQRQQRNENCDDQWTNERNKLQHARDQAQDQRTWKPDQRESDATNYADHKTRCQLRADVSGERAVDVLKKFIAAPTQTATRQHRQSRAAKAVRIFQKEEREDWNQHQPG